ncbi:putative serine/threonine-protein kinase K06H7.1 [Aphelenchoides besseyi]|nr:putative serine/threonine-protein kinase K06H7.1 [Aphelenchoides besseyi]
MPDDDTGPVALPIGKMVGMRWKVTEKLGEGGCGSVYLVMDVHQQTFAAMKVESNSVAGGPVLKQEVTVLKKMRGRKWVARLITAGKKENYSYMVMTLFGPSLNKLFKQCKREFSVSTQVRLGMQMLFCIKQLHEVGYVHRDVKPANLAIGLKGPESRMVHLLDFGLVREYVTRTSGRLEIRRPRANILFRGTLKYCSQNTHLRSEQGRPDDLWSLIYVLAEFRGGLPWANASVTICLRDKKEVGRMKSETSDESLLHRCPPEFIQITNHLRNLDYYQRPDYKFIYDVFYQTMCKYNINFGDAFDWELRQAAQSPGRFRRGLSRILSITEDQSVAVKTSEVPLSDLKTAEEGHAADQPPFTVEDFAKNEIGF